ncbi:E3 ubiquitin-protein ligase DZIP3-like isoform X2 [Mytilus trossulus]|uniref:E3 ubiquitin-protein ligase DZIP3-like isoform X2 n=1 Tax=Mytilus trossulus TaxID=6551 RepID=UPI003003D216
MTSTSQLSEEEINFTRFFLLNFKVSPDIARRFFDGVFPPAHLPQTINNRINDIIKLKKSKIINTVQFEILRSVPGTVWPPYLPPMPVGTKSTSSKDFDLTLVICLLRNLGGLATPINGWDKLPHPNDTVPGADLATLKWYRNDLAHATVTCMVSNEFTDKWTQVEKALTS